MWDKTIVLGANPPVWLGETPKEYMYMYNLAWRCCHLHLTKWYLKETCFWWPIMAIPLKLTYKQYSHLVPLTTVSAVWVMWGGPPQTLAALSLSLTWNILHVSTNLTKFWDLPTRKRVYYMHWIVYYLSKKESLADKFRNVTVSIVIYFNFTNIFSLK